jgi:hypothetical protein
MGSPSPSSPIPPTPISVFCGLCVTRAPE